MRFPKNNDGSLSTFLEPFLNFDEVTKLKKTTNFKILKMTASACLIVMLAGCSNSPSNGDIKAELEKNLLHGCSLLSISDFEKVNGIPDARSDKIYQVQVTYTIDLESESENKKLAQKMPDRLLEISGKIDRYREYREKYANLDQKLEAESNGDHMGVLKKLNEDPELSAMKKEHEAFEKIYPQYYLYKGDEAQMILGRMRGNLRRACPEVNFAGLMPEKIEDFGTDVSKSFEATYTMRLTDNGWQMAR